MVRTRKRLFIFVFSVIHVCFDASLGHVRNTSLGPSEHTIVKRTWYPLAYPGMPNVPGQYLAPSLPNAPYNSFHKTSKKSDLPEKGQIKFMKTLLGKVKTLLHDGDSNKKSSSEKKIVEEKISHVASSNDKLYGVFGDSGDSKEKESEKSVNVISIPLKALGKVSKTEAFDSDKDSAPELASDSSQSRDRSAQVVLRPLPVRSESEDDREEIPSGSKRLQSSLLPVIFQTPGQRYQGAPMMIINPKTRTLQPLSDFTSGEVGSPLESPSVPVPYLVERHGDIARSKSDVYRDIGHIPGEFRSQKHTPDDEDAGRTSLRHKNPEKYNPHASQHERDRYDDDDDDDDDYDEDDDEDDDDEDDDEDGIDDRNNAPQMNSEERELAATRKRLFSMLPGNDPTYTSENRGLNLMNAAASMQAPEAFLGNPMLRGMGFNQRNSLPFTSEAMAGEHADNSNDRNVFMLGNHGTRQVFGDSLSNAEANPMRTPPMMVNNGAFTLGGSPAQAMSPNEVSYILQKQGMLNGLNQVSQKDKISRPKITPSASAGDPENVLIEVNGKPIGETKDLRNHVVGDTVVKGQEKVIKSKGPLDVKISRACDGIHAKVVDISSSTKIEIAKSKITKVVRGC